jgi:hypothetical protein
MDVGGREFIEAQAFRQHREPALKNRFGADPFFFAFDSFETFFENFGDERK